MMLKRRVLDYGLTGILILIPAAIFHSSLKDPSELNGFDQAVLRVSSPLQAAATWAIEGIGGVWNGYVWLVDVEEENDELRAENQQLRQQLAHVTRRSADAEVYRDLAGLREATTADTIGARVISSSTRAYFRIVRIRLDRGKGEVETGMPVINEHGLVGRIGRVYGDYADVLLVSDSQSRIDVKIQRTGSQGSLRGIGRDGSYACEIEILERNRDPVEVDDVVVTSGLGEFPPDLVVGHIKKVTTKDYGMFQEVEVAPVVDFANLRGVVVLLARPPAPDPNAGKARRDKRAFGATPY